MAEINALDIQEAIGERRVVTVPWIQMEYGLDYRQAKQFLAELISRGWIVPEPKGLNYRVLLHRLRLRKIIRDEIDSLIENMTLDCGIILNRMAEKNGGGTTFEEMRNAVHGIDDAEEAIETLERLELIYKSGNLFFSRVSKSTLEILVRVAEMQFKLVKISDPTRKAEDYKKIKNLFERLFKD